MLKALVSGHLGLTFGGGGVRLSEVLACPWNVLAKFCKNTSILFSIYTLSDLGVLSNLIGSLSLANEHYSPPTE